MKRFTGLAAAACLGIATGVAAQPGRSAVQRQIQPILDSAMQAANAHDADRFLEPFLHDSTLVFVFNGGVTQGFDALRAVQLKAWNNGKTDVAYTVRGPTKYSVLTPAVAVVTLPLASRRTLPSGEVRTADLVVMMVWQKRADGWRIVAAHESTVH